MIWAVPRVVPAQTVLLYIHLEHGGVGQAVLVVIDPRSPGSGQARARGYPDTLSWPIRIERMPSSPARIVSIAPFHSRMASRPPTQMRFSSTGRYNAAVSV